MPSPIAPAFWTIGFAGQTVPPKVAEHLRELVLKEIREIARLAAPGGVVFMGTVATEGDRLLLSCIDAEGWSWKLYSQANATPQEAAAEPELPPGDELVARALRVDWHSPADPQWCDDFQEADIRMVDQVDLVLVLWDGGTEWQKHNVAEIVSYAHTVGKPLVWIRADGSGVTRENPVGKAGFWNAELLKLKDLLKLVDLRETGSVEAAQFLREAADKVAEARMPRTRRFETYFALASFGAALCGALTLTSGTNEDLFQLLALGAMTLLLVSLVGKKLMGWRRSGVGVPARILCELARSSALTLPSRDPIPVRLTELGFNSYQPFITALHVREFQQPTIVALEEFKALYLTKRIEDQRHYFLKHLKRSRRLSQVLSFCGSLLAGLGIAAGVLRWALHYFKFEIPAAEAWVLPVSLVAFTLPAVAGALTAVLGIYEFRRRASIYSDLDTELQRAGVRLRAARTWERAQEIVAQVEFMLLNEIQGWKQLNTPPKN